MICDQDASICVFVLAWAIKAEAKVLTSWRAKGFTLRNGVQGPGLREAVGVGRPRAARRLGRRVPELGVGGNGVPQGPGG